VRLHSRVPNALARTAAAAVAVLAVTAAAAGAPAVAGAVSAVRSMPTAATVSAAASRPPDAGRPVLLINGDRLMVRPASDGRSAVSDLPAVRNDSVLSLHRGSITDEIPADALPYLRRGLDPSLFDLTALQRAEAGGRLPVQVTFAGHQPDLPGATITRSGAGTAAGYLTVSSARAFGAALQRQFRTDHATGSYGSGGLFAGGADIALAGTPAPTPPVRPDFPMHTLTVTASNLSGKPDNGDVTWVFDADNLAAFDGGVENVGTFYHGVAKFSVPAGRYWVIGEFASFTGAAAVTRLDFLRQVTISQNTTAHVAEHAASSEITMATPRPAMPADVTFTTILGDRLGSLQSITWFNGLGPIWVSPVSQKPAVGTLQSYASEQLTSPHGAAGAPYAYNLDLAAQPGIIPAQHYQVRPPSLATVTEMYYQDVRSTGDWTTFGAFPNQGLMAFSLYPLALPGPQIQYFSAAATLLWSTGYDAFSPANGFPSGGQADDTFHVLRPGEHQIVDWNRYPLHPQPNISAGGAGGELLPLIPSAIRTGNTLTLTTSPFSDNQPGHLSAGSATGTTVTLSYEIDQNGVRISGGSALDGIPAVTLRKKPSAIRFTLDASRAGPSYVLSPSSETVWTWRSRQQSAATVSPSWYCSYTQSGTPLRRCIVQPMMTLSYRVRGLALTGTATPGQQLIDVQAVR
jgi:hypothetical protein